MVNGKWKLTGLSMKNGLIKTNLIYVYTGQTLNISYYFQVNIFRIISANLLIIKEISICQKK